MAPPRLCFADPVSDLATARLRLHPVDEAEARRIRARTAGPADRWAEDYPFAGDLVAVDGFLRAARQQGEQRPFGYYQVVRAVDGLAVGGVGFKGCPSGGVVEIGYGLVPSARGRGYATEAVTALLTVAANHAVTTVLADTDHANVASQRTLLHAGFTLVSTDAPAAVLPQSRLSGSPSGRGQRGECRQIHPRFAKQRSECPISRSGVNLATTGSTNLGAEPSLTQLHPSFRRDRS